MHWKAVAFIRAFTLSRMLEIKTGVNSLSLLCLWKMVVLVGILMLNWLPLIGGEPGVQITHLIVFMGGWVRSDGSCTLVDDYWVDPGPRHKPK